jgi:flavin-dependent dehydrogenase
MTSIAPTIVLAQVAPTTWDAIVVGAGPAGAFAAMGLARAGLSTLLVDRKSFPRPKVCGGCLNAIAVGCLEKAGVADALRATGAQPVSAIELRYRSRRATLELPAGLAVSRATLDAVLVRAAISAGVAFLPETSALVEAEPRASESGRPAGTRGVVLQQRDDRRAAASARFVVVADGLAHTSLRNVVSLGSVVRSDSRVGIGAVAEAGCIHSRAGCVTMTVGRGGYVGFTTVENGCADIAAAFDVAFLKAQGGPASAVRAVLSSAGVPAPQALDTLDWQGTPPLTRRMALPVAHRVFVLGDAAGYIEPFTGEGMAWAISAAAALVPVGIRAVAGWDRGIERQWLDAFDRSVRQNQWWCRTLARTLRHPSLVGMMVASLSRHPVLARPFLARMTRTTGCLDD